MGCEIQNKKYIYIFQNLLPKYKKLKKCTFGILKNMGVKK